MSLFPDITPLVNQVKEFNQHQIRTHQLLTELKEINSQILKELKK